MNLHFASILVIGATVLQSGSAPTSAPQSATEGSLAARFDAVVRSVMPEWVLQPVNTLYHHAPNEEYFVWRRSSEVGPGLNVTVRTYDTPELAERALQQALMGLSIGGREIQGVGDHAVHVVMLGRTEPPPWMGHVYARVGSRLLIVGGDKDGADVRALAAALATELRTRTGEAIRPQSLRI
jgi:hypothetical protein